MIAVKVSSGIEKYVWDVTNNSRLPTSFHPVEKKPCNITSRNQPHNLKQYQGTSRQAIIDALLHTGNTHHMKVTLTTRIEQWHQ